MKNIKVSISKAHFSLKHLFKVAPLVLIFCAFPAYSETPPEDHLKLSAELGMHAGESEKIEYFMVGENSWGETSNVRFAEVVYARYYVCLMSINAMNKNDIILDMNIWQAYNNNFIEEAKKNLPPHTPVPIKLESRAMSELGEDCQSFTKNAPEWIVRDETFGPYSVNPDIY